MAKIAIVNGDLIQLAKAHNFGVIAHITNCMNRQKRGIARVMSAEFNTHLYNLEALDHYADYNKLGQIEARSIDIYGDPFFVVNMYAQYHYNEPGPYGIPLDYDALRICLRKVNNCFNSSIIGLPYLIGCGLAGGDPLKVLPIIEEELKDCNVTLVQLPK